MTWNRPCSVGPLILHARYSNQKGVSGGQPRVVSTMGLLRAVSSLGGHRHRISNMRPVRRPSPFLGDPGGVGTVLFYIAPAGPRAVLLAGLVLALPDPDA